MDTAKPILTLDHAPIQSGERVDAWDLQIERDAKAGKLDWLAEEARKALRDGTTEEL